MGRSIETQKSVLELGSQQNAATVDLWRAMFRDLLGAEPMFNWAEQTVENLIGMRRRYLDTVSGQSNKLRPLIPAHRALDVVCCQSPSV